MAGTIAVDLDTLPNVITALKAIHDDIATQKGLLNTQYTALQEAISGTAPIIQTFENSVSGAAASFDTLDTTLQAFITTLGNVLSDAQAAVGAL